MDPITMAATKFAENVCAFLRRPRARTLRIVAEPDQRRNAMLTLRLIERAPDNGRRFFLYEEPFTSDEPYFAGLATAVCREFPLRAPREGDGLRRATLAVARAAESAPGGVLVALLPPTAEGFAAAARTWTGLPFPLGVKLAVLGGEVGDIEARFVVDYRELARFYASAAREVGEARAAVVHALLASVGGDFTAAKRELNKAVATSRARGLAGEAEAILLAAAGIELEKRDAARANLVEVAKLAEMRGNADAAARTWKALGALVKADAMDSVAQLVEARSLRPGT